MGAEQCSVCTHPNALDVDEALVAGETQAHVAKRYGLTAMSVSRHRRSHLSPALAAVQQRRERIGTSLSTSEKVEDLYLRASAILDTAERGGQGSLALQAIRDLRGLIELLAKLTGELDERPTVKVLNVQTSSEWLDLRGVILQALMPYPEAKLAVATALDSPRGNTA